MRGTDHSRVVRGGGGYASSITMRVHRGRLHVCSEHCGGNVGSSWNLMCARNSVGAASELDVCEYMDRWCSDWCLNINVYKKASYFHTLWNTVDESLTKTEPQLPRDWEISQVHLPTNIWNDTQTITGVRVRGFTAPSLISHLHSCLIFRHHFSVTFTYLIVCKSPTTTS